MERTAAVVGSGPNGLAAAIVLAQAGFKVEVFEAAAVAGGCVRTGELTLPGYLHDIGSAVYPMAAGSPFFSRLDLENVGLEWVQSPAQLAHPFDDGSAVTLERDVAETSRQFGRDAKRYREIFEPLAQNWSELAKDLLRPVIHIPRNAILLAQFGARAMQPTTLFGRMTFREHRTRTLFAGIAAHSCLRLESPLSAAFGFVLTTTAHAVGWPIAKSGARHLSNALIRVLETHGGKVFTTQRVTDLEQLGDRNLVMCDVTPRQFLGIAGKRLPTPFRTLLQRFQYGPGIFKIDWALREPIPWRAPECRRAITVHLGGSIEEIAASERATWQRKAPERPFVLLAQPSLFDSTRAPEGRHTAWAYCHVPNAWSGSALRQIEDQVERFAPGFRECILARSARNATQMNAFNENLIGGDINGGSITPFQFALRPTWRLYETPLRGVYLCSSSTPPGGGVHGMCGYWAARRALKQSGMGD